MNRAGVASRSAAAVAVVALASGCRDKRPPATDAGAPVAAASASASADASIRPVASASASAKLTPSGPPFPPFVVGAPGWDGVVHLALTGAGLKDAVQVTLLIKHDRVRYASPTNLRGLAAITIVDVTLRRLVTFAEDEKVFARVELPPADADADAGAFPLVAIGKKLKIAGLDCEVFEQKRGKASSSACVHEGLPFVDPSMTSNGITPPPWLRALAVTMRFPLRAVEVDDAGREVFRLEAKDAVEGSAHPRVEVPSDYVEQKIKLPGSPFRPGLPD